MLEKCGKLRLGALTRATSNDVLHFIGTSLGLICLFAALLLQQWWLLLAVPVVSYAFAWAGHFFVEANTPATFSYPLWSLRGDVEMYGLMLRGRMHEEVRRLHSSSGCYEARLP